jgi:hypothetical protein
VPHIKLLVSLNLFQTHHIALDTDLIILEFDVNDQT